MSYGRFVLLGLLTLPLSACGLDKMMEKEDHKTCEKYGFQPGTDAFAKCMQKEAIHRDEEDDAAMDRAQKGSGY
jgi:hypothetical protein